MRNATNHSCPAPYVMLVLAVTGIVDAGYDSYAIFTDQALWCPPPIDGCNTVASSPYARILGIPLGYLGVVYYVGMAATAALMAFTSLRDAMRSPALVYAAAGLLGSATFFYIQFNYIHAFCIYCMISALLTVLLFAAALMHYFRERKLRAALVDVDLKAAS
jgi:uncharacterized membrane protein